MNSIDLLDGAYDIHVHASPDVVPRATDLAGLRAAAQAAGMAGVLIKDHCTSTVGRVAALNGMPGGGCRFFSALALNFPVGGLNPTAVEAALRAGVDVIYFPTYSAAHHIRLWGAGKPPTAFPLPKKKVDGITILDAEKTLIPEALEILKLVAEHRAVLSTGHLSPEESLILLAGARECGIERMLVTHASESVSGFTIGQQQAAIRLGAAVEHSFFATTPSCPHRITLESLRDMIREVGLEHVILSSDFGQTANGAPVESFARHLEMMQQIGLSLEEIRQAVVTNPGRLLPG